VQYEGRTLVDGFVGATVPVAAVAQMGADVIIAVFLDSEAMVKPTNFTDVIGRSFSIIQRHADLAWRSKADVVVEPRVRDFAWDDFAKTPQLITAGEEAPLPGYACVVSKIHVTRPIDPRNPQFKRTTDDLARMRTALLDALVA